MNKLTKIERFFKETPFTADDPLFAGVDVHKKSYHVALYFNDAPLIDFMMPVNKEQFSKKLKTTAPALRQVACETGKVFPDPTPACKPEITVLKRQ